MYKKRVEVLTSKKNDVKKTFKRKMQDVQSQKLLREKKKQTLQATTGSS